MRYEETHRHYSGLRRTNSAWNLLVTDTAPRTLAFIGNLFEGTSEVSIDRARAELEIVLSKEGLANTVTTARLYINNWVDAGWLREQNQHLSVTAATQAALQFVEGLVRHDLTATASHLETVNEEMRRLLMTLSPDVGERARVIDEQIADLEAAKERLLLGKIPERTEAQKREHTRHVLSLATALTQDFRFLEDEMRRHEAAIHQRILDEQENRGSVLGGVLDAEDLLRQSPAGQAFDGFYTLLGDEDRSAAFRSQIRRLLLLGAGDFLTKDETKYLADLVNELIRQSDRVIERRRSAIESLKAYMLSGSQEEHRAVDQLLKTAGQVTLKLKETTQADWKGWNTRINLTLNTGKMSLRSAAAIAVTMPAEDIDEAEIVERVASRELNASTLNQFSGLSVEIVALRTRAILRQVGNRTIGELAHIQPIQGGIEEVLALLRIARATQSTDLRNFETIFVTDKQRGLLKVKVPTLLLQADAFPEDINELNP